MEEEYKNIFEMYEVSNFGNVRKKLKNGEYKIINCSIQNRGYKYFQINRNKKRTNYLIHHLVAKLFIGERPENLIIDHIDRNKLNNNVSNLRYVTQKKNMSNQDRYITEIEEEDPIKRKKLISKRYAKLNRDKLLNNKKEYYKKNKEYMLNQYKHEKYSVICNICKNERLVSRCSYNRIKREGIDNNICKLCSSKINIKKTPNLLEINN